MNIKIPNTIVTYHVFSNTVNFERHLKILSKKDVLLTTDDGDISFYNNAFPLIKKYKIPTILFIIPSLIGTDKPFWWDELVYYLGETIGLEKLRQLKSIPNHQRINYLENLRKEYDKPPLKQKQLTVEQLTEMQNNGIIIGNHSFTHPMFNQCTKEEIEEELIKSKDFFKKHNFDGFNLFAYPNGNFDLFAEEILVEQGIKISFLFDHKKNTTTKNPLRISRLSVNDYTPIWKYKLIITGWHSKLLPLTKLIHNITRK